MASQPVNSLLVGGGVSVGESFGVFSSAFFEAGLIGAWSIGTPARRHCHSALPRRSAYRLLVVLSLETLISAKQRGCWRVMMVTRQCCLASAIKSRRKNFANLCMHNPDEIAQDLLKPIVTSSTPMSREASKQSALSAQSPAAKLVRVRPVIIPFRVQQHPSVNARTDTATVLSLPKATIHL